MGFQDMLIIPSVKDRGVLKDVKHNLITKSENDTEGLSVENFITLAQNGVLKTHGHIHEFLERSEIQLISTPPEPRNPDLEARIQKLKAEQENAEYRKMTRGLHYSQDRGIPLREDVKLVTSQITAVLNFVLTVAGTFFFVYKAVEYALPESNIPAQVMMGIVSSTIVALADLYFLARTI